MTISNLNYKLLLNTTKKSLKSRFVRYGIPFLVLMVGGSFGLKNFTSLRYEYSKKQSQTDARDLEKLNSMKKPEKVTLESEYEKIKELDIDNWTNVRGPRPWEQPVPPAKSA